MNESVVQSNDGDGTKHNSKKKHRNPNGSHKINTNSGQSPREPRLSGTKSASNEVTDDVVKRAQRQKRFAEDSRKNSNYFGFVSRGEDQRLQKSATERELFFRSIMVSFISYCNENSSSTLNQSLSKIISTQESISQDSLPEKATTIDLILANLRKLREALLYIPMNEFSKKVFLFSIRVSSTIGNYQTYIPSIMFLLQSKNRPLLTELEVAEISTLLVLHVSHFNGDNSAALRYNFKYLASCKDVKTLHTLRSWIHRDYYNWFRIYNTETDGAKFRVMSFGLNAMVESMVSCVTKSYFTINLKDLEDHFTQRGLLFDDIVDRFNVKWRREGDVVVIRERKAK